VAAVDAEDKTLIYHNWLGINKGDLSATIMKGGKEVTRVLEEDKYWTSANKHGDDIRISGRALAFVRNVGIHMYTDAV
jgi:malate synthase